MKISSKTEVEFLAAVVQKSKDISVDILDFLDPGYFSVESYQWFVKVIKDRGWDIPAWDFVDQLLLESVRDEEKRENWRSQLYHLYVRELTYTKDAEKKFRSFVSYSIIKSTAKSAFESFDRTNRMDYMIDEFSESLRKAEFLVKESEGNVKIVDWAQEYDKRVDKRILERDNPELTPIIKTGIKELDVQFEIKGPMIVDYFAPFKRYKSIVLNHMSFAALLQGFNVLHVVYENTIELTSNRFDSLFSLISYDRMVSMAISKEEKERVDRLFNWVNSWPVRLKIMKCQPKETTIQDVRDRIERLKIREGFMPDVVIIDYLNIVKPVKMFKEERLQQGQVVWDMKNLLADAFNIPVITATQSKMEGTKVDRLSMDHRGKSVDISQGVNLSIAINQTQKEKDEGLIVFCPLFSRESDITIPEVVVDSNLDKMVISRDLHYLWDLASKNFPVA